MPASKPVATVATVASLPTSNGHERGIPVTIHLTPAEHFALRQAFESGRMPGTMDDFGQDAIHTRLELFMAGGLAGDAEFQLAMFHARREREDHRIGHHISQADDALHAAHHHLGFYMTIRADDALAEYINHRWREVQGIPIPVWKMRFSMLFQDEVYAKPVATLKKRGHTMESDLLAYLGL